VELAAPGTATAIHLTAAQGITAPGGHDQMIISLFAAGWRCATSDTNCLEIGSELSYETISKINNQVAEEWWQRRPLEPVVFR
jgi:hypothetical protein